MALAARNRDLDCELQQLGQGSLVAQSHLAKTLEVLVIGDTRHMHSLFRC